MDAPANLIVETRPDGILLLTINRPAQYNALNEATLNELSAVLAWAHSNVAIRAILITGGGQKSFIAGADINEFTGLTSEASQAFAERGQKVLSQLELMPKPVLAAINGFALGGGCEVAMACHIRIASEHASLGQPEVKLGIIPGYGGTQRLARLVGRGKALEMMLTGAPVSATEAHRIGLVNHVVSEENLISYSLNMLMQMLQWAPIALGKVIEAVNATSNHYDMQGYAIESLVFAACCHSDDFREGVKAFVEKRVPNFKGE